MAVQGWRHAVALCFWGQPQASFPVLVVTVNRWIGRADFSQADIARMEALHPVLDAAVARLLQRSTLKGVLGGLSVAVRDLSHGLLVLDSRRRVVLANRAARRLCEAWDSADGRVPQHVAVLQSLYVVGGMRRVERGHRHGDHGERAAQEVNARA